MPISPPCNAPALTIRMKITKRNTPPAQKIWKGTCRVCGSQAEATREEMTNVQHDQREGGSFSWGREDSARVCSFTRSDPNEHRASCDPAGQPAREQVSGRIKRKAVND